MVRIEGRKGRWDMGRRDLPHPPDGWREDAARAIDSFDPSIRAEAMRILSRRETEMALVFMMEAANGDLNTGDFYHALRICSQCATSRPRPFANRKRARSIVSAIETVLESPEIAFFFDETNEGRAARWQLAKAKEFAEENSKLHKGAGVRHEQYDCLFQLHKVFQARFRRPVAKAIASWMKATFPRNRWGRRLQPEKRIRDRRSAIGGTGKANPKNDET